VQTATIVTGVDGQDAVRSVRIQRQEATGAIESGRAVFAPIAGSEAVIPATTVLVAVGEEPDPSILPEGAGIGVSAFSGIAADRRTLATGRAGVFAGGDVVTGAKTIIDAVAAGRRAAASIHEYLAGVKNGEAVILAAVRHPRPPERSLTLDLSKEARKHPPLPVYQPGSFKATQAGFDEGTARAEAARCFRCDAVARCGVVDVVAGRGPRDVAIAAPALGGEGVAIQASHNAGVQP
jgi:NADPH-dependent glutamate synthase beta subunit-like oxidoreductase